MNEINETETNKKITKKVDFGEESVVKKIPFKVMLISTTRRKAGFIEGFLVLISDHFGEDYDIEIVNFKGVDEIDKEKLAEELYHKYKRR